MTIVNVPRQSLQSSVATGGVFIIRRYFGWAFFYV
jgi:hypothetical protein